MGTMKRVKRELTKKKMSLTLKADKNFLKTSQTSFKGNIKQTGRRPSL